MLHKEPDGSHKIPRIIYADAYASEMVAYADHPRRGAVGGPVGQRASVLAALCVMAEVLAERRLFFAEARHTVTLYYGASAG